MRRHTYKEKWHAASRMRNLGERVVIFIFCCLFLFARYRFRAAAEQDRGTASFELCLQNCFFFR